MNDFIDPPVHLDMCACNKCEGWFIFMKEMAKCNGHCPRCRNTIDMHEMDRYGMVYACPTIGAK